jgi:folate-binding protein YgfZ
VYTDDGALLLDTPADRAGAVMAALEKFIVADDVELSVGDEQPLIALTGPASAVVIGHVLQVTLPPRTPLAHQVCSFAGERLRVIAVDEVDGAGYTLCGRASIAGALRQALADQGAEAIGRETLDVLRVEAGIPLYGVDMDEEILLMETNLDRAVSFTKGCYLGQEVVERVAARGKVNKKLTGLRFAGDAVPTAETPLRADGRDVGRITSAVRSPGLGEVIALGYVHRDFVQPGTLLTASTGAGEVSATVTALPFIPQ